MQKRYRVKPGQQHGFAGPGSIVEMDEKAAEVFLDKLELAEGELGKVSVEGFSEQQLRDLEAAFQAKQAEIDGLIAQVKKYETTVKLLEAEVEQLRAEAEKASGESEGDMSQQHDPARAPGGGFEPSMATVEQVKAWIEEDPGRLQAAVVLQSERDGKNRKTMIEALEAYIQEKGG